MELQAQPAGLLVAPRGQLQAVEELELAVPQEVPHAKLLFCPLERYQLGWPGTGFQQTANELVALLLLQSE